MGVPPVGIVYQRYSPFVPPDADSVSEEGEQPLAPVVEGAGGASSKSNVAVLEIASETKSPLILQR